MDERMEAIMRKLTAMALSMMFILGSVIPVGAEETQIRQTKISLSIDPVYTVTIPANTTIERGEQSVKLGSKIRARQDCKCICKCKWKT